MSVCWTFAGDGSYFGFTDDWDFNSWPNSFYIYQGYWSTTVLSTPSIAEPVHTLQLSFWARVDYGEEQIKIGTLTDPEDISTFKEFLTLNLNYNWQNYVVSFNDYQGTDTYIGLMYGSENDYGGMFIDDIVVEFVSSQYTIIAEPNNPEWGSVEGAGLYEHGEMVTLTAIAASNYKFIEWQEVGVAVSSDPVYIFTANKNRTILGVFDLITDVPNINRPTRQIVLHPNPAKSLITISLDNNPHRVESITVIDMFGRAVINVVNPAKADSYSLDISQLKPGAYVVRIVLPGFISNTRLIVK